MQNQICRGWRMLCRKGLSPTTSTRPPSAQPALPGDRGRGRGRAGEGRAGGCGAGNPSNLQSRPWSVWGGGSGRKRTALLGSTALSLQPLVWDEPGSGWQNPQSIFPPGHAVSCEFCFATATAPAIRMPISGSSSPRFGSCCLELCSSHDSAPPRCSCAARTPSSTKDPLQQHQDPQQHQDSPAPTRSPLLAVCTLEVSTHTSSCSPLQGEAHVLQLRYPIPGHGGSGCPGSAR